MPVGDGEQGLIREVRFGAGALLAVGDPSIFLNAMLRRFYGNKQLAANMMRYFCVSDPCTVTLVVPGTTITGRYRAGIGKLGEFPRILDEAVSLINASLERFDRRLGRSPAPSILVLIALLLAVGVMVRVFLRGRQVVEAPRPSLGQGVSPQRHEARALLSEQDDADFSEPVRTLLREFPEVTLRQLLLRGPRSASAEDNRRWKEAKAAVLRIQREADSVRQADVMPVGVERFMALLNDVRDVGHYLEETSPSPTGRPGGGPVLGSNPSSSSA